VQSDMLDADQVLSRWKVLGNGEGHACETFGGPGNSLSPVGHGGDLVHFEPDIAIASPARSAAGCFSHVDVENARVVDSSISVVGDSRTSCYFKSSSPSIRLARVAPDVCARDIGHRVTGVVIICLPHVDPSGSRVDRGEGIMSGRKGGTE